MRIAVFSTRSHDREFLEAANAELEAGHELVFLEPRLLPQTVSLGFGFEAICAFVNDQLDGPVLRELAEHGTRHVLLRSAGFNHVNLEAAEELGVHIARVPAYSPASVAEHTVALILGLNRKTHRAYQRVREGNFALQGLLGFDLQGRCVGVVGTGKIGQAFARIMLGFGCEVLASDPDPDPECESMGVTYLAHEELLERADIVSLHCPLTPQTHHFIDDAALERMRPGAMLINTSRGALVDTRAVISALKRGQLGALGLDVYEEEGDMFFQDLSDEVLQDDVFARLLTFPNVLITAHQAFFTRDALERIAQTTVQNAAALGRGELDQAHLVKTQTHLGPQGPDTDAS